MEALVAPLRHRDPDALVVLGAADVYIPVEQAERQRGVFPRARIEILPGVGHWAWLEQPDRVAAFVVPFLRDRVGNDRSKTNEDKEIRMSTTLETTPSSSRRWPRDRPTRRW